MTRKRAILTVAAVLGVALITMGAVGTYQYKDNLANIFNIQTFQCGSATCTAMILEDSSGNEKFTVGNNGFVVDPTVASNQSVNAATTAHTCSTGGFSELGCLGKIDDDINAPQPAGTNVIGYTSSDPCAQAAKSATAISSQATGQVVVTGVAGKKVYICSMNVIVATATAFSVVEGTGSTCAGGTTAALYGSTTATAGAQLATQGGFTEGSGSGTIMESSTASNQVCVYTSAVTQYGGNLTYVQQ